jgi:hypothetical protein
VPVWSGQPAHLAQADRGVLEVAHDLVAERGGSAEQHRLDGAEPTDLRRGGRGEPVAGGEQERGVERGGQRRAGERVGGVVGGVVGTSQYDDVRLLATLAGDGDGGLDATRPGEPLDTSALHAGRVRLLCGSRGHRQELGGP